VHLNASTAAAELRRHNHQQSALSVYYSLIARLCTPSGVLNARVLSLYAQCRRKNTGYAHPVAY